MDDNTEDPRETPHHPRRRYVLYGQDDAERQLLRSYKSGRLHHAWLLTGLPGIGKATLAYRFARFILVNPEPWSVAQLDLGVDPQCTVARRIEARGHSDLFTIERAFDAKTKRVKANIDVEQARRAATFFSHTAGEGGWRVCIIDAVDDLNLQAANALLKILEEPPARSVFLLVSNFPGRLLPTISSRCVKLHLTPLDDTTIRKIVAEVDQQNAIDHTLPKLYAAGSAGRALQLGSSGASKKFAEFLRIVAKGTPYDRKPIWALCEKLAHRKNEDEYRLFCELLQNWSMVRARDQARAANSRHLANVLAERSVDISHSIRRANALNLDRRQVILDAIESIELIELA